MDINSQFTKRFPGLAKLVIRSGNHCRNGFFPGADEGKEDHV